MKSELFLARRYLFRGKAKHISFIGIISCLGLILGVFSLIVAFAIVNGVDGGLLKRIMEFKDHVIVESLDQEKLEEVKNEISTWEEVDLAYLWLQTQIFAKFDEVVPFVVRGIDFSDPQARKFFYQYVRDDFGGQGFFLGQGAWRRYVVDEVMEFYPLEKRLQLKEERVKGIFNTGIYDIDNYFIFTDLEEAKNLSPNYILLLGARIKDQLAAGIIKDRIREKFPEGVYVTTWIETNQAIFSTLKLERLALFIILSLIIVVASFNIFAILTIKVVEKTKDIGILRSIGFTARDILSIFTLQGLLLGVIGVVCGSLLGIGACHLLTKYPIIRVPQEIFGAEYLPIVINYNDVYIIALAGIIIAFLSSLIPAYRASRLIPSEALRYE
jgi:lipoprotein-releasing system permease protein